MLLDHLTFRFKKFSIECKKFMNSNTFYIVLRLRKQSEQAQVFLTAHGIECYNGGSWLNVNYLQAQAEL
jgi:hypothetical protein